MMDTIAQRHLESVSWGLKMRLYTGAGLSTLDLVTDLSMIFTYATTEGQQGTAWSLAGMVGLCLAFQLLIVWVQTRKGPRRVMLKEMLIVLSGTKPGWDAVNVVSHSEQSVHAPLKPEIEMTITRGIEMCFESIPGSIVTTYATLKSMRGGGGVSIRALVSIVVSALTTGFGAATISYE
jgi:hypothetical protein